MTSTLVGGGGGGGGGSALHEGVGSVTSSSSPRQQQQALRRGSGTSTNSRTTSSHYLHEQLLDTNTVDQLIVRVSKVSFIVYLILVALTYITTPTTDIRPLSKREQDGARIAFWMMLVAIIALMSPFIIAYIKKHIKQQNRNRINRRRTTRGGGGGAGGGGGTSSGEDNSNNTITTRNSHHNNEGRGRLSSSSSSSYSGGPSNIVYSALMVNCISLATNFMLGYAPVVTKIDPIVHTKIYVIRWCEWIPLAGHLTFMADIVDCTKSEYGVYWSIFMGITQSLSCFMVLLFPYAKDIKSWLLYMILSCLLYLVMFPRCYYKYIKLSNTNCGMSYTEMERYDRLKFGFSLFLTCTIIWTSLVIMYFANIYIQNRLPVDHILRHDALEMFIEATHEVVSKVMYARLIVDVHLSIFASENRK